LVHYEPYQGVSLTDSGQVIALKVLRRHRLIETFLVQILQIPWELVHSEADRLEHSLSDYLEERMDELLGHPSMDPHGSPIPGRDGKMDAVIHLRLADLPVGASAEIVEVNDRDPQLLTRLDQLQLQPNSTFKVVSVEPLDGLVTIQVGTAIQTFGPASASQIYVRVLTDVEHAE
jgi:DtxR family Mn-dependent transcriptional regulator